jgi:hypothetical protein
MNRVVVRTLSKTKLCITLQQPSLTKRFERSTSETVEGFIKRLKSKLTKDIKRVTLLDSRGIAIDNNIELHKALISSNKFVINDIICDILVDPPTIELLKIPDTPVAGWLIECIFLVT